MSFIKLDHVVLSLDLAPTRSPPMREWSPPAVADRDGHLWEIADNPYSPEWAVNPVPD